MDTFIIFIGVIFGILQITLFFKIWNMTSNVERIHKLLDGKSNLEGDWEKIISLCKEQVSKAKRMKAIGEEGAEKILKGLIYDLNEYKNASESQDGYFLRNIDEKVKQIETLLDEITKN